MKWMGILGVVASVGMVGCAPANNPIPTREERESLSKMHQLTSDFDKAGEAYFSPDGEWLIFQAVPKGEKQYQMYLAKVQYKFDDEPIDATVKVTPLPGKITVPKKSDEIIGLGRAVRITPENSRNTCGFFSRDGKSILFASTAGKEDEKEPAAGYQREGGQYRWSFPRGMEIYRADGWLDVISNSEPGKKIVNLAEHRLTDNDAYDAECAYSPDGKYIVFTSDRSGDLDIYVMHADGSNQTRIVEAKGYDGGAFFSPDGKSIVYRSDRKGNNELQIMTADLTFDGAGEINGTRNERQLTSEFVNWGPYWHPSGEHIVYASSAQGHDNYEIYLMRKDGSRKTRITFSKGADVLPVVSPDGKFLVWSSKRTKEGTVQVFVAKLTLPRGS